MQPFGFSSPGKPSEKSIDLQYFFMKNDTAGAVMANALLIRQLNTQTMLHKQSLDV
jgi:hypothetical protein